MGTEYTFIDLIRNIGASWEQGQFVTHLIHLRMGNNNPSFYLDEVFNNENQHLPILYSSDKRDITIEINKFCKANELTREVKLVLLAVFIDAGDCEITRSRAYDDCKKLLKLIVEKYKEAE